MDHCSPTACQPADEADGLWSALAATWMQAAPLTRPSRDDQPTFSAPATARAPIVPGTAPAAPSGG